MTAGGTWAPERRFLTVALIGLVTAAAFEGMAVPTVLPAMAGELGDLQLYGWAFSAFWLTNIVGITLAGADADRHGPARALAVGTVLFAVGMLVAGIAPSMPVVIFRCMEKMVPILAFTSMLEEPSRGSNIST